MATPIIIELSNDTGPIAGRIHDYGHTGIVDLDTYPNSMGFALARATLGRAVIDGRVRIPHDASKRFGVGDYYEGEGTHSLRFTGDA